MGFILFLVALVLLFLLTIINYIFVGTTFMTTAKHLDIFGNMEYAELFNRLLITKDGYMFGNSRETISSVLGKNLKKETLTKNGKIIVWILTKEHCINSINNKIKE